MCLDKWQEYKDELQSLKETRIRFFFFFLNLKQLQIGIANHGCLQRKGFKLEAIDTLYNHNTEIGRSNNHTRYHVEPENLQRSRILMVLRTQLIKGGISYLLQPLIPRSMGWYKVSGFDIFAHTRTTLHRTHYNSHV